MTFRTFALRTTFVLVVGMVVKSHYTFERVSLR